MDEYDQQWQRGAMPMYLPHQAYGRGQPLLYASAQTRAQRSTVITPTQVPTPSSVFRELPRTSSYSYSVKVINPSRKRDAKTLTWHITDVFTSPMQLKERLIESFHDHVPGISEISKFNVGFFESRNSAGKRWIISSEDLERMYSKFDPGSEIPLWCDGKLETCNGKKRSTDETREPDEAPSSKREKKESNIDSISLKLQDKHGDKFSGPQYKLWARLIDSAQWNNMDRPPNMPIFGATQPKRNISQKDSTTEVIANAAVAIIEHLRSPPQQTQPGGVQSSANLGVSPGKKAKLRKEYLDQLKDIQKLRDDGTLTHDEFLEEKRCILETLKSMK